MSVRVRPEYAVWTAWTRVDWVLDTVDAGERSAWEESLRFNEIEDILRYSTVSLPRNHGKIRYAVIEHS